MRGRTNVGGGGIALNANVVNKEVASGNIIAGDFVEYYTVPGSLSNQNGFDIVVGNIGEYTIIIGGTQSSSYGYSLMYLIKNDEIVDIYEDSYIKNAIIYNNFVVIGTIEPNKGFGTLRIINDKFVLIDFLNVLYGKDNISIANGKIFASATGSTTAILNVCDISDQGMLSNANQSAAAISTIQYVIYHNGIYYGFHYNSTSEVDVYTITFSESGVPSISSTYKQLTLYNVNPAERYVMLQTEDYIIFKSQPETTASAALYYVTIPDFIVTRIQFTFPSSSNYNFGIVSKIENGQFFAVYNNQYLYYYIFNEVLKTITLIDNFNTESNKIQRIGYRNGNRIAVLNSSLYDTFRLFELENDTYIQDISDKDYVIPYTAGHPIGVAKDPGSTGDTIGVYIPVSS